MLRSFRPLLSATRNYRGVDYVRNRFTNKGTAFTHAEREYLGVVGLLPPAIESIQDQAERYWTQFNLLGLPINRYQLLRSLLDNNVTLYYYIITHHLKETLPVIYTPTVGEACQRYGALYQKDHGLYLSAGNIGSVRTCLKNLRKRNTEVIVVTDGSRILGLGDLGANGMGISIGKSSLYVAAGGIPPGRVLPVMLDVGTNNEALKNDPLYLGTRVSRVHDKVFYALLDEFMEAAAEEFPNAVIQFEDFSNNHCFDMLERYQMKYRCFNDDIQGTGAVISAGFLNALKISELKLEDHRVLFFGAGSAAVGVAKSIIDLASIKFKTTPEELKKFIYFVDSKGLVAKNRGDTLAAHKLPFAREDVPAEDLSKLTTFEDVVKYVKPTALIGLGAQGGVFTEDIIRFMSSYCPRPIIFPLSNPTSKAEVIPANAYKWSNGKAIVASGSPFPESIADGKILRPSQGNNLYIFPGVGLGCAIARPPYIPNEVLVTAARSLGEQVNHEHLKEGALYPPIDEVRAVSRHIAVAVIRQLQEMGLAQALDLPTNTPDLTKVVAKHMWVPQYPETSFYLNEKITN